MKDEIKALIAEARSLPLLHATCAKVVGRLCEELEKSAQLNEDTLAIKIGLHEENQRLRSRIEELETVCAESYQVVGALADVVGVFNEIPVIKALDNLSAQKLVHTDVLPFSLDDAVVKQAANYPIAASVGMTGIPAMSPECFRQNAMLAVVNGMLASGRWDSVTELVSDALITTDTLMRERAA